MEKQKNLSLERTSNHIPLWKRIIEVCNEVENEYSQKSKNLQMHLDVEYKLNESIINLLYREDISDSDKILTLKNYFTK